MPKIQLDDIKVYYQIQGSGKPLICLHGNGGTRKSFRFVRRELAKYRTLYLIDTRMHGKTSDGKRNLSYPLLCEDLKQFIDALGLQNPDIIGYSDGGITALCYAAETDNVGSIVTIGANWTADATTEEFEKWVGEERTRLERKRVVFHRKKKLALLRLMTDGPYPNRDDVTKVSAPVLLMAGDADVIPLWHTEWLHASIKGSEMCIVDDCGHSIMREQPACFLDRVKAFLRV